MFGRRNTGWRPRRDRVGAEGRAPTAHARQWPMTRSELIHRIAQKQSQLVERDVELAVKMMLNQMAECLAGGGRIEIRGFASFTLRLHRARVARNPKTGTPVSLPARYAAYFKPGNKLRERVNRELSEAQHHSGESEDPTVRFGSAPRLTPVMRSRNRPVYGWRGSR